MADIKYKDSTPVDEPVSKPKPPMASKPPKPATPAPKAAPSEKTPVYRDSVPVDEPVRKLASGGTASSRADGIAQRGKTKGTIVMCGGGMYKK